MTCLVRFFEEDAPNESTQQSKPAMMATHRRRPVAACALPLRYRRDGALCPAVLPHWSAVYSAIMLAAAQA
jgi:hypothetical protein